MPRKQKSDVKMHFMPEDVFDFKLDKTIDETVIIPEMKEALAKKQKKEIRINVSNLNRALGTLFGARKSHGNIIIHWKTTPLWYTVPVPADRVSVRSFRRV